MDGEEIMTGKKPSFFQFATARDSSHHSGYIGLDNSEDGQNGFVAPAASAP